MRQQAIGHVSQKKLLTAALQRDQIHNSYLFCGSSGIGKRTLAEWFAAQLLATEVGEQEPEVNLSTELAHHPDFYSLEPEVKKNGGTGAIKIESAQSLIESLRQQPLQSNRSVILIDQAHYLTTNAANALLKTLEEPRRAVLLLVSDQPEAVLPTIRSRCQTLYFQPLSESECETVLSQFCDTAAAELTELIELSPGQPGQILQHCLTVAKLSEVRALLQPQERRSIAECLKLSRALKEIGLKEQIWLLEWWQRSLLEQPQLLECFNRAIAQIQQHVHAELVWNVILINLFRHGSISGIALPEPVTVRLTDQTRPKEKPSAEPDTDTNAKPVKAKRTSQKQGIPDASTRPIEPDLQDPKPKQKAQSKLPTPQTEINQYRLTL